MSKEESILFLSLSLIAFLIGRLPVIGKFLRVFHTLFHEGGHALAAWISGGEVLKVELFYDTSGTTISRSNNKFAMFFISIAGYIFASLTAFVFIILLSLEQEWLLHTLIISISVLILFKGLQNIFGIIWILLLLSTYLLILLYFPSQSWIMVYAFTGLLLYESLYSSFIIASISIVKPAAAGDTTNLAKISSIPSFIWGLMFLAQAIFFTYLSLQFLFID